MTARIVKQSRGVSFPRLDFGRIARSVALWCSLWRERRDLGALDDRMLRDIGVSPFASEREVARVPWDVPAGRP
ncbi:MAG: DUF1127 domain-containing protein [Pseudomonadota bacterium]